MFVVNCLKAEDLKLTMKSTDTPHSIIVMGKIGSGKSSLLNSLIQTDYFKVGDSGKCETRIVQTYKGKFKKRFNSPDILFIDTPGFIDNTSTTKIASEINTSINKLKERIDLVLFCFPSYEIRLKLSMKICCRFLKVVMDNPIYDRIVIVLTHGNRLSGYELESAVAKMTTEFIPYLKNTLKSNVSEEVLIYRAGNEEDGLDEVIRYMTVKNEIQDKELVNDPNNQTKLMEYLTRTSQSIAQLQETIVSEQTKNSSLENQLKQMKEGIEKRVKDAVKEVIQRMESKLKDERSYMELFKESISREIRLLQYKVSEKDKEIVHLRKELEADRKALQTFSSNDQNREREEISSENKEKENKAKEYVKDYWKVVENNNPVKYMNENKSWRHLDHTKVMSYQGKESGGRRNQEMSRTQMVASLTTSNSILMAKEINVDIVEQPKIPVEPTPTYKYGSIGIKRPLTQSRSQAPIKRVEQPYQRSTKDVCTNYYRYKINLNH